MGLIPYAASEDPNQPAHKCSLLRSFSVCYKAMQGLVFSIVNNLSSNQSVGLDRLVWNLAGHIWHKTHFRMKWLTQGGNSMYLQDPTIVTPTCSQDQIG
ncbi:hypothetical protein DPMN_094827 [Dreissena polymorpha]|uniref:Uncharacterized protein n=1 Tax=Dreissena polymorpha TaxID=45954 RepID=A0A9D4L5E0_DREPO|nr:hypothetical protein DPMN_094827 [Dreissena polymorpha]